MRNFCWYLFCYFRLSLDGIAIDLVSSIHLLLCCLSFTYSNARPYHIICNPELDGVWSAQWGILQQLHLWLVSIFHQYAYAPLNDLDDNPSRLTDGTPSAALGDMAFLWSQLCRPVLQQLCLQDKFKCDKGFTNCFLDQKADKFVSHAH